jgi:hypothetical protein
LFAVFGRLILWRWKLLLAVLVWWFEWAWAERGPRAWCSTRYLASRYGLPLVSETNGTEPGDLPRFSYVVGRLDRAIRQELDHRLAPLGLTWPQYTALSILRRSRVCRMLSWPAVHTSRLSR